MSTAQRKLFVQYGSHLSLGIGPEKDRLKGLHDFPQSIRYLCPMYISSPSLPILSNILCPTVSKDHFEVHALRNQAGYRKRVVEGVCEKECTAENRSQLGFVEKQAQCGLNISPFWLIAALS